MVSVDEVAESIQIVEVSFLMSNGIQIQKLKSTVNIYDVSVIQ